jgi:putative DNA primase/helicase
LPFDQQIPADERDPAVKKNLMNESSGPAILNWLLEGCLLWQEEGLEPPEAVEIATKEYQEEVDPLTYFLEDCCITGPGKRVGNKQIWQAYREWVQSEGIRYPLGRKSFTQALRGKGFDQISGGTRDWLGIGLLADFSSDHGTSRHLGTSSQDFSNTKPRVEKSYDQVPKCPQVPSEKEETGRNKAAATSDDDDEPKTKIETF